MQPTTPTEAVTEFPVYALTHHDLAHKPVWTMAELCFAIDVPFSTLLQVIDEIPAPIFLIGRRRFIRRDDAIQWIDELAEAFPYTKRRNARLNPNAKPRGGRKAKVAA